MRCCWCWPGHICASSKTVICCCFCLHYLSSWSACTVTFIIHVLAAKEEDTVQTHRQRQWKEKAAAEKYNCCTAGSNSQVGDSSEQLSDRSQWTGIITVKYNRGQHHFFLRLKHSTRSLAYGLGGDQQKKQLWLGIKHSLWYLAVFKGDYIERSTQCAILFNWCSLRMTDRHLVNWCCCWLTVNEWPKKKNAGCRIAGSSDWIVEHI